jgi:hypothetical protein
VADLADSPLLLLLLLLPLLLQSPAADSYLWPPATLIW